MIVASLGDAHDGTLMTSAMIVKTLEDFCQGCSGYLPCYNGVSEISAMTARRYLRDR